MHVRGQIRSVFETVLDTVTLLGGRVFVDSDEVPEEAEFPLAVVTVGSESIEHQTLGGSTGALLQRELTVNVSIFYQARREALLAAEEIAADVETKIASSSALAALVESWVLQSIDIDRDAAGAQTIVQMNLEWSLTYATNERDPTVAIP